MISGVASGDIGARLAEMGLSDGENVTVLFKAPLGDPIAVQVGDYVLSIRNDEASIIQVEPA